MCDSFAFTEEKPDHHFRTEIPNIVEILDLSAVEIAIYFKMKRAAGDDRKCTRSIAKMAKELKVCENTVRKAIKKLQSPFELLNKKPLIRTMERKKNDKSNETNIVMIVNIWAENGAYFRENKKPNFVHNLPYPPSSGEPPPLHQVNPPPSSDEGKEEPLKKNMKKEQFVAERGLARV